MKGIIILAIISVFFVVAFIVIALFWAAVVAVQTIMAHKRKRPARRKPNRADAALGIKQEQC